jgi:hypothetical protein
MKASDIEYAICIIGPCFLKTNNTKLRNCFQEMWVINLISGKVLDVPRKTLLTLIYHRVQCESFQGKTFQSTINITLSTRVIMDFPLHLRVHFRVSLGTLKEVQPYIIRLSLCFLDHLSYGSLYK